MSFDWLKRYMPRGLYGRAALILILPVVAVQLIVSLSFIQRHFEDVTEQMTRSILLELQFLTEAVAAAGDAGATETVARQIGEPLQLDVTLPAGEAPVTSEVRFLDLSGRVVVRTLDQALPELVSASLLTDRRVRVWLDLPEGLMEVSFSRQRVSASNPHQLIVLIIVLSMLMVLIAYIYLRNQLRPIRRMARAAQEYGQGRIVPYTPRGALEVRAAGHAFLDMRNRIERQAQARTLMLSGVSHDLRTPLTRLRLGLELMEEAEAAPLLRDVDEMRELVDAFLDHARGDGAEDPEPTDLTALVRQVVADAGRGGAPVELVPVEGVPRDLALRSGAVRRALENLVGNALRYGARAEIGLVFAAESVRITVEDDGPGIPEERRREAVRPFTRLDPARNQDRGSGVGLGLAIVTDIARAHGGRLTLGQSARLGGLSAVLDLPG